MSDHPLLISSIILLLLALPILYLFVKNRFRKAALGIFDVIINASEYGQVVFDENGNLFCNNEIFETKFCAFIDCMRNKTATQACFLNYLYDHAVDYEDSIKNTIVGRFSSGGSAPDFCEVISVKKGALCLVNARKINNGMTLFTLIDISSEQEREKQFLHLDAMSYQLMQAVQASSSGIVISDPKQGDNPILFANDAFCAFVDSDTEDLTEKGWSVLAPFFDDMLEHEKFMSTTVGEFPEIELELIDRRDTVEGSTRYYTLSFSPVYHDGELDLFIGLLSDITPFKQREAEFFNAQKLESLGKLSAGVAHDFNNILSIISGNCSMMRKVLPTRESAAGKYLERVEVATRRGADLSQRMLAFSSHKVIEKVTLDMCDVIVDQIEFLEPLVGASVKINPIFPKQHEEGVCIKGSVSSIAQILMNFVINACDAMPSGGNLEISLSCLSSGDVPSLVRNRMSDVEDFVCLSVKDDGTGMDEETVEKVFDPFFSTKEQGQGTGLGLSVVYGLVKELGGQVDVVSKLNIGTTMSIYLPRCDREGLKTTSGDVQKPESVRFDGYTALIAEDEPELLNVVKCMLEDLGMNVLTASDGEEALVLQEGFRRQIDILLTDVLMPGIDGVRLAELLTSLRPETKVVFMSGFPAGGNMAPVELPPDAVFVAKPVAYEKLIQKLYFMLTGEGQDGGEQAGLGGADMPEWKHFDSIAKELS